MKTVSTGRHILFWVIALSGLAADLVSKQVIFQRLSAPDGSTDWFLDGWLKFRFYTSFNEGALWGLGQGYAWLFAIMSILAFAGVLYWLFIRGGAQSLWLTITLAMISAGTLGNLYDRLGIHGYSKPNGEPYLAVRDFFHFVFGNYNYPIFNIADMLLVSGAVMLVIQSFFAEAPKPQPAPAEQQPTPALTDSAQSSR
jgi:signal peptidase II